MTAAHAQQTYDEAYAADRAEIEDLMARSLFAIDYFDWDAYVATFAEDGKPALLRHVVLQTAIRVEGEKAWGRTLWVEMANDGPGDSMKMGTYGIYEDEFSKASGRWLIAKRRVLNEFLKGRQSGPGNPVADMDRLAAAAAAE